MKLKIPLWVSALPDNARLSTSDLVGIFNVNCSRTVTKEVSKGNIPKPDGESLNRFKKTRFHWSVKYLKSFDGQEFAVTQRKGVR